MAELGLSTSSSATDTDTAIDLQQLLPENAETEGLEGPSPKKLRVSGPIGHVCLEERLNGILCCTVCLDLPTVAMFQVHTI